MRTPTGFGLIWLVVATVLAGCVAPAASVPAERSVGGASTGSVASLGGSAPQTPPRAAPKRFTAAIRGYPKSVSVTIDAASAGSTAGIREVAQLTNAGLVIFDGDGVLRPQLAQAVPSVENGLWKLLPDGRMETTWKLKPGAVWHDGTPFTAEDLAFTVRVAQDKTLTMLLDPAYEFVERAEAVDASTFVVHWKQPYIAADGLLSHGSGSVVPMPRHLLEAAFAEDKANFTMLPYWGAQFVGLGPFKVRDFVLDSHLVLAANDSYVLGRPKIDEIDVRFVGDFTVMVAQVLAGAVDFNFGRGLSLEQALQARDQWRDGRLDTALNNVTALWPQFVNPNPSIVGDLQFRRAMLHAIDRQQLADSLQASLSPVADNPLVPSDPDARAVEADVVRYEYDPRRAAVVLEGLGLSKGSDGLIRDGAGERLTVKIQTTNDDLREKMLSVIGDYWRQVGVGMEPYIVPRQLSNDRKLRTEFASFDFTRQPTDLTRYHSTQAPLPENNYRGSNRSRYRNAELDGYIDRYFVTIPTRERQQILGQMVRHVTENVVLLGIFFIVEPALISNRIKNVTPRRVEDALHTWNAHEWDLNSY